MPDAAPPGPALLEVAGAGFVRPGGRTIFRGIGFALRPGQVMCVLGPNGAGKTTLLRCLNGLDQLSAGTIRIGGQPLPSLPRAAVGRMVATVPQADAPVFAFSVREVVEMGRAPHLGWFAAPGREDAAVVEEVMARLGLLGFAERLYPELSGGERQLVLIARALVQRPRLLLLDEPTAHLDLARAMQALALVQELAGDGLAVVMTSHDPDHAFLVADRTLAMAPGRCGVEGATRELLTEARLSALYGWPITLAQHGGRTVCIGDFRS